MSAILENLFLGPLDCIYEIEFLKENKITHIISVIEDNVCSNAIVALHITQMNVLLLDVDDAPMFEVFERTTRFIRSALAGGGAVYVHCYAGISRSPTVVAAYLIAEGGMTKEKALEFIAERRPIIDPNDGFRAALEKWEATHP